ncbi:MAG: hypothetical protein AB1449_05990 [Chloroflexota bacterium]
MDRRFLPAYRNLAHLYQDQKDWESCLSYGLTAEKYGLPDKEVELAVAEALMGLGHLEAALARLVEATLIGRDFIEAYETMLAAYVDLGMHELALAAAREALSRNPHS